MKRRIKTMVTFLLGAMCVSTTLYPAGIQAKDADRVKQSYKMKEYTHNEIVVQLEDSCSKDSKEKLFDKAGVIVENSEDGCYVVKTANRDELKNALSCLQKSDKVEIVQPNFCYEVHKQKLYNDTYSDGEISFSQNQWALKNNGTLTFDDNFRFLGNDYREEVKETTGIDINIMPLWQELKGKAGKRVVVAMVDSGVDIGHQALKGRLWKNTKEIPGDHVDNDHNGYVDDYDGWNAYSLTNNLKDELGHGTHCAGIIAANGVDNVWGVTGKADVCIMPVKVFSDKGKGDESSLGATSFSIRCGIKYAEKNGADICNLSLGMPRNDQLLEETIQRSNMLFVCAAGNEGNDLEDRPCYPGNYTYDNVITVGNIRCDGNLHLTSNYNSELVPVAAPGTQIYSTMPEGKYEFMSGTSMAAPHVTGIAALLYSYMPHISAGTVKKQICLNAKEIPDIKGDIGYGLVDAYSAYTKDVAGPVISRKVSVYKSQGYATIKLNVTDEGQAGVKRVSWEKGSKTKSYFAAGVGGRTIQPNGTIKIKKTGYYTIYSIDNNGNESSSIVKVTIPEPKSVKLNRTSITLKRGKTYTLRPYVSPSGVFTSYTYSSANTSIATVNANGKITAKRRGTVAITVRTRNGKRCTCKVTVK